ncbi:spore coat polysaccharide biosynthesis protein SpsF [Microterricola gilva]|uniref:Spore coat polysaccharide biosynthesis protein SpsF n=1 Tax=Microterricola gilva TaxID=393267 RepID=A0A4Q8APJ5_9MICO|nr:glycosyltransferase family protein [Microterricola gilva]RZU66508.1 spore coat polysaccharide biosynthesis protein SpsF [Microterricola gilva]
MSVLCLIQARAGSSRLPGKVFADIGGEPMLSRVVRRAQASRLVSEVAIATTVSPADDLVEALGAELGVKVHRGSEFDVLDRYYQALQQHPEASLIVRITADCPFMDPAVIDAVIRAQQEHNVDFAASRLPPPYPRTYPVGLDVEVVTRAALERTWAEAREGHHREHVMPFIYENPDSFSIEIIDLDEDLSSLRWTVDTPEDLALARALAGFVPPTTMNWLDLLRVVRMHPELSEINAGSTQKTVDVVDERWEP